MTWRKLFRTTLFSFLLIVLSLLLIAGLYIGYLFIPARMRIVTADRSAVKEVPYFSIVLPQNCQKYKEWLVGNIPPMLWPNQGGCPFDPIPADPIGHFIINGVKLDIPREYIIFEPYQPDGAVSGISMRMQYPMMKPATDMPWEEGRDYNVIVSIESKNSYMGKIDDASQFMYEIKAGIERNRELGKETSFKLIKHHDDLGLDEYVINGHEANIFYIHGDYKKPYYWVECTRAQYKENGPYPHCGGWFNYNDKIYVYYFFPKWKFEKTQLELRNKIIKKIDEFIDN
jgi:hypothetical protein